MGGRSNSPRVRGGFGAEEPQVELTHWSSEPRKIIDPNFAGSNAKIRGNERIRRGYDNFHKRTYWGLNVGTPGGYKREQGVGPYRHLANIGAPKLYDLDSDPSRFKSNLPRGGNSHPVNEIENRIRQAGFSGYRTAHPELGSVAAIFDPITPHSVEKEDYVEEEEFNRGGYVKKAYATSNYQYPKFGTDAVQKAVYIARQHNRGRP